MNTTEPSNHYECIEIKIEKGIFRLIINRPEVRNALDNNMLAEIDTALDEAKQNDEVKVLIIEGAGGKSFAAGADIKQLHARKPLEALIPGMQGLYSKIENFPKVTIAVVNGYALGGGCELAMACDIRIASNKAKFGLPELNLGIIPGAGGTQRLARLVGKSRALDMILTGRIIDGEEAERIGLANYYVHEEELHSKVAEIAEKVIKKGPIAVQLAKYAVHKGFDIDTDTALWLEKLSQAVALGTEDKQEGTLAFIEKREANFKNR